MSNYTDEIFENQRRGLKGWTSQLLITDREPFSDRAGDPIRRDPNDYSNLSMWLPNGWKWTSDWTIDTAYTACSQEGWSYGKTFGTIDKRAYEQQSRSSPQTMDTCRRRRWIRTRERIDGGETDRESLVTASMSPSSKETYGQETKCQQCSSKFNLLRRRHHCRRCHDAVCKDCCQKAIKTNVHRGRPQLYCRKCIIEDDTINSTSRMSRRFSSNSIASNSSSSSIPAVIQVQTEPTQEQPIRSKFCIECGNELPPNVKFCIECGTSVKLQEASPVANKIIHDRTSNITIHQEESNTTIISEIPEKEDGNSSMVSIPEESPTVVEAESPETTDKPVQESSELVAENSALKSEILKLKELLSIAERQTSDAKREAQEATRRAAEAASSGNLAVTVKDSEEYAKYFKLLKMGMPPEQVKLKISADGLKPDLLDTPDAPFGSKGNQSFTQSTVRDSPEYEKYFKLLKMGMPMEQVKLKVGSDGLDPKLLDTPDAPYGKSVGDSATKVTVKDSPEYAKYFKLLKMGMPADQVKLKMTSSGLNPDMLDNPDAVISEGSDSTTTIKDDPNYEKYFKLLKMGMPTDQIKLKMKNAGLNPDYLDTPDAPITGGSKTSNPVARGLPPPKEAVKVDLSQVNSKNQTESKEPPKPALPKKAPIKPKVEMRSLFWTRIPVNVVSNTMWGELSDNKVDIDSSELEWMFRKNIDNKKGDKEEIRKRAGSRTSFMEMPKKILLLDPKRQQNVGIAIARFRMPVAEIKQAILNLDGKKLGSEQLQSLISIEPTTEEQDMIKNFEGDIKELGNVEKFFLELLEIPRYTQRIKCFRFKLIFENRILETQAQLDTLTAATDQLSDSVKFRRVLEFILGIGNYMNGSTPRGGAYGFKMGILTKLHTVRSVDHRITLMNFLVRQIEEHSPELIAFAGELPHVKDAKRLSLTQLKADLNSYNTELSMLQGQIRACDKNDKFFIVMSPFAEEANEVMEELKKDVKNLETGYSDVVSSFGEDYRKVGTEQFFSMIDQFVDEFKKAYRTNQTPEYIKIWDTNRTAREEAEEEEKARKQEEKLSASTPEKANHVTGEEGRALYEQIIQQISVRSKEVGNEQGVEQFKSMSRKYGSSEITAENFCNWIGKTYGKRIVMTIVPSMAKLLPDEEKRKSLLDAHEKIVEIIRKDREEKRKKREKEAMKIAEEAEMLEKKEAEFEEKAKDKARSAVNRVKKLKIDDIQPVEGEEAQQLHRSILEAVSQAFNGDAIRVKEFSSNARRFGNEQISAKEFYKYLTSSFEADFVARLVPDLARLLQDATKRHALLKALCESAPGWARFAGL